MLRILLFTTILCIPFLLSDGVQAEEPPAIPPVSVQSEILGEFQGHKDAPETIVAEEGEALENAEAAIPPAPVFKPVPEIKGNDLVVLELFSTQACPFCPKADALMKQFVKKKNVIALSCHVDYFDVSENSLALPVCSSRQIAYEQSFNAGPKYTPQAVINGRYDAVGYSGAELSKAMKLAEQEDPVLKLKIKKKKNGYFDLHLPETIYGDYRMWLFVFDHPHTIQVSHGANTGKEVTYYNVISKAGFLGKWSGGQKTLELDAKMHDMAKGFTVLVHDSKTNNVIAATQYLKK